MDSENEKMDGGETDRAARYPNESLRSTARWKKRLLLVGCGLVIVTGIAWATSPKPSLLRDAAREASKGVIDLDGDILARFDAEVLSGIQLAGLELADKADWYTVCRRISLALVGTGMSLEEIRALEQIEESDRVRWWTEYLLRDRRSADYLAERLTRATVGTNEGPFLIFRRRKYANWLADELYANSPYDELVRKLITANGSWTDAPQVNFFTATINDNTNDRPDLVQITGRTARSFLAQRIDCLQCHRDYLGNVNFLASTQSTDKAEQNEGSSPVGSTESDSIELREGEQEDFHRLAAFFAGVVMENPFVGLRNKTEDYKVRLLDASEETVIEHAVPYMPELLPKDGAPRQRLAHWLTHPKNRAFARATVNRVWAMLYGRAWIQPVDSIPLDGPFPKGFELLVDDFIQHRFDLRRLIRVIIYSEAFQRDSRFKAGEPTEKHEELLAVFPLTQLRPEQVAGAIHQACRIKAINEASSIISRLELFGGINNFTQAYGDRGDDEFEGCPITIPQRLLVMNGDFIHERINENPVMNAATRISNLATSDDAMIRAVYQAVLNRLPNETELAAFREELCDDKEQGKRIQVEDIYWTLLNSTEFLWNH
ncbi:MAG: DUF1553 domain-containing protein [Pirellula sp.]|nr:DUF1553 domain-containing protein [Pirellula sp.]